MAGSEPVGPDQSRQVFNDTDAEVLWLIVSVLEDLEFLPGAEANPDLSLRFTRPTRSNRPRTVPECSGRRRGIDAPPSTSSGAAKLPFDTPSPSTTAGQESKGVSNELESAGFVLSWRPQFA